MVKKIIIIIIFVFSAQTICAEELFTKNDIVKTLTIPGMKQPFELKWGLTERTWNQKEIFITVHSGQMEFIGQDIVHIYAKDGDKYRRLQTIDTQSGYFRQPNMFWYDATFDNGKKEHINILQITEKWFGTGSFTTEHVFEIKHAGDTVKVIPIEYVPAPYSFAEQLKKDEGVWKGEFNTFSAKSLDFEFYIWHEDDANCCPSAGRVTGRYKIENTGNSSVNPKYRIVMDTFKRHAYDHLNEAN